jgi:hypothetical protein
VGISCACGNVVDRKVSGRTINWTAPIGAFSRRMK